MSVSIQHNINKKATEFLTRMQEKQDASKRQLRFSDKSFKPKSIEAVIDESLKMLRTESVGKKRIYPQYLGSSRSMQDMYLLCKYYFPKTTIFDVSRYLNQRKKRSRLGSHFCSTFRRMMFTNYGYCQGVQKYLID